MAAERVRSLFSEAEQVLAVDPVVCAYRASPELFVMAVSIMDTFSTIRRFFECSGDIDYVEALRGREPENGLTQGLSPRETEIHGLVVEGLTNKQIARALYISESTVKVHVQHIFDKLGIRSRAALRVRAARERGR
jgi:DNA-binding NarL/FixJ family response regulator